jgi:hypothetical protein
MKVKTTYLQMFARPERVVPPPREGLAVVHAKKPTVAYYSFLYDGVGRDYDWTSLKQLSDAELTALLYDPRLEVHVLMAEGVPAGFAELDRRIEGEIELVQFGFFFCFLLDSPSFLPYCFRIPILSSVSKPYRPTRTFPRIARIALLLFSEGVSHELASRVQLVVLPHRPANETCPNASAPLAFRPAASGGIGRSHPAGDDYCQPRWLHPDSG